MSPTRYIPNLDGKVHPDVAAAIRNLVQITEQLERSSTKNARAVAAVPKPQSAEDITASIMSRMGALPGYEVFQTGDTTLLKQQASIVPTAANSLSYTNDGNDINWSWTGLRAIWPNGDTEVIPDGTQPCSGLTLSTTYIFYPRFSTQAGVLQFVDGPSSGEAPANYAGAPAIAFKAKSYLATAQTILDQFAAYSAGGISAATTGGGAGPGGSGGGSSCLHEQMVVLSKKRGLIPIAKVSLRELILGRSGWVPVTYKWVSDAELFIGIALNNGEFIKTTPSHPLYRGVNDYGEETVPADRWSLSELMQGRDEGLIQCGGVVLLREKARAVAIEVGGTEHNFFFGERTACVLACNAIANK